MDLEFKDAFIGGMFEASMLGLMDTNQQVITKPLFSALAIRFDGDFDPCPMIKETIKEAHYCIQALHV